MRASATSRIPSSVFPTITLCLVIGLGGCNTFSVRTDYDDEADFATLTSFAWVDPPDDAQASPFADNGPLRKRVRQAGAEVLNAKGYREADEADAAGPLALCYERLRQPQHAVRQRPELLRPQPDGDRH